MKVHELMSKLRELDGDMVVKVESKDLTLRDIPDDGIDVWDLESTRIPVKTTSIVVI